MADLDEIMRAHRNEKRRAYYWRTREARLDYQRKYQEAHRDEINARARKRYAENLEKCREINRRNYYRHQARRLRYEKARRAERNEYWRTYYQKNKERLQAQARERYRKKKQQQGAKPEPEGSGS